MKTISQNTILAGIGIILVLALVGMPIQNAQAEVDSTQVLYKLQSIQSKIDAIKDNTQNFDINKIASQAFHFRLMGEDLLTIQESHNLESETISKVLDYLMTNYEETLNEYKSQVEQYEKHNSIDMTQKQIINDLSQNLIEFTTADERYQETINQNKFVQSELQRLQNEEKFQEYINKVAIKIVDANNGNKVQKIYHEVALEQIAEEENWKLVSPAMDRVIEQFSNPEIKQHLTMYKEKVLYSIESLEKLQQKHPEVLTLTNDASIKGTFFDIIFSENNEILTPSIISAQLKDEIKSLIQDSQKIVEEENKRIQEYVEAQREDSRQEDDKARKLASIVQSEPESEPEPESDDKKDKGKDDKGKDDKGKGKK